MYGLWHLVAATFLKGLLGVWDGQGGVGRLQKRDLLDYCWAAPTTICAAPLIWQVFESDSASRADALAC